MSKDKLVPVDRDNELENNTIVFNGKREVEADYLCYPSGHQFRGIISVQGKVKSNGKSELIFTDPPCPECGSKETTPHVRAERVNAAEKQEALEHELNSQNIVVKGAGIDYFITSPIHYVEALRKAIAESGESTTKFSKVTTKKLE